MGKRILYLSFWGLYFIPFLICISINMFVLTLFYGMYCFIIKGDTDIAIDYMCKANDFMLKVPDIILNYD